MTLFDFLQLMGGVLLALGYVPQIIQIKTTHSCKDLNLKTYATIFVGICLMEVYAINLWMNGSGYMFLITNTVSLVIVYYICMLILMEQEKKIIKPLRPVDAFFVSQWDDGSVYVSPCKVNLETKEILEIVTVPYIGRGNLYSEHLVLHGQEYSVSKDEGNAKDGQYWY